MPSGIHTTFSYYEFPVHRNGTPRAREVLWLAEKTLKPLLDSGITKSERISHLVVSTTCPDALAPSLGQMIAENHHEWFSHSHNVDLVQGCAGGVAALALASQLSLQNNSDVVVISADAAGKASSVQSPIHANFGNGSFACLVREEKGRPGLIGVRSRQYKGLSEVVTVKLGHDADALIMQEHETMRTDPRRYLGLDMDNVLAVRLLDNAEAFYLEFIQEFEAPDIMILHQVNAKIIKHLKVVFGKYPIDFVDVAELTGNCGAASTGIALDLVKGRTSGKKVMLCSFGTGGVISAGLWQC